MSVAAGAAAAADLPSRSAPPVYAPPPPAAYDWTGFYIGVNGGLGIDHFGVPSIGVVGGVPVNGFTSITSSGPVLGGQVGYNYEFKNVPVIGHAVVGIEVDENWADVNGHSTAVTAAGPAAFATRLENFGTARLRAGYNFDRLLVYVTGGLTYSTYNASYNVAGFSASHTTSFFRLPPQSQAVGAGIEYAINNNWSIKAEYLYDAVVAQPFIRLGSTPPGATLTFLTRSDYSIVRLGLNYKFDFAPTPAPIVAKY